jgi:hypothetical protein
VVVDMEDMAREALLLTSYLGRLNRRTHTLSAEVSLELVAGTPPFDRSQPLTRREEQELHDLYGWPVYWWEEEEEIIPIGGLWDEEGAAERAAEKERENPDEEEFESPQLLFAGDLLGIYGIQAEGEEVGRLQDLVLEDETWAIPYVVIGRAAGADRALLSTDYIETTDLAARRLHIAVPADAFASGPVFRSEDPLTPELIRSLHEYYDRYSR